MGCFDGNCPEKAGSWQQVVAAEKHGVAATSREIHVRHEEARGHQFGEFARRGSGRREHGPGERELKRALAAMDPHPGESAARIRSGNEGAHVLFRIDGGWKWFDSATNPVSTDSRSAERAPGPAGRRDITGVSLYVNGEKRTHVAGSMHPSPRRPPRSGLRTPGIPWWRELDCL